jgi:hypothetical protein
MIFLNSKLILTDSGLWAPGLQHNVPKPEAKSLEPVCNSSLRTACPPPSAFAPDGAPARLRQDECFCGRKKLPFAGYSIVKEHLKHPGDQPAAATRLERPTWRLGRFVERASLNLLTHARVSRFPAAALAVCQNFLFYDPRPLRCKRG